MRDYLVFHLYGPLAAWGDIAVGEVRGSDAWPTRSALLGLIAAALGLVREDRAAHAALCDDLGMAVETRLPGRAMVDYHTVQSPKGKGPWPTRRAELAARRHDLHTLISRRTYYQDGYWVAAIWSRAGGQDLGRLAEALAHPVFTPCLGRRACPPALPMAPRVITAQDALAALAELADAEALKPLFRKAPAAPVVHLDLDDPAAAAARKTTTRRDAVADRPRRQFALREEAEIRNPRPAAGTPS